MARPGLESEPGAGATWLRFKVRARSGSDLAVIRSEFFAAEGGVWFVK
jgi:hypothetical protein